MIPDLLDQIYAHLDEPIADSSLLPTFFNNARSTKLSVSKNIAFGRWSGQVIWRISDISSALLQSFSKISSSHPPKPSASPFSLSFISNRLARGKMLLGGNDTIVDGCLVARRTSKLVRNFLGTNPILDSIPSSTETTSSSIKYLKRLDQRTYLSEGVLTKVNRASGAFGVEVRSPFLDQYMVELAAQIPLQGKILEKKEGYFTKTLASKYSLMDVQTPQERFW